MFPESTRRVWSNSEFQVTARGNRTGLRLAGPTLRSSPELASIKSQPVVAGSVQVPPDGAALVLLSECQTIGGYPQIAHIISADLPCLTTAQPGRRIRFEEVSLEMARQAWADAQRECLALRLTLQIRG